jgi:predicted dienelactone hydrolase
VDDSRPTNPNGDFEGASERTLEGRVWHPADGIAGPYPLVVYSHGFTSSWAGGAYLGQHLASLGYVVVSVNYPLTHFDAPGGPNVMDVVNQPADISFMIDSLLADSASAGHVLEGMVDGSRVGVTGISLGGMTSTLVAFHPDMRDARIGGSLSIAGPTSFLTERFFTFAEVPFLMLAGDIDALVPYPTNAAPVPDKVPGSELVTIAGASHTGFSGPASSLRWMDNPDAIGCYMVSDNVNEAVEQEPWYDLIGSVEQGIDHEAMNELCLMDPLPPAMNVLRQHMITTVVVSSFFESLFAIDPKQRRDARVFLSRTLPNEVAEVSYQGTRG